MAVSRNTPYTYLSFSDCLPVTTDSANHPASLNSLGQTLQSQIQVTLALSLEQSRAKRKTTQFEVLFSDLS